MRVPAASRTASAAGLRHNTVQLTVRPEQNATDVHLQHLVRARGADERRVARRGEQREELLELRACRERERRGRAAEADAPVVERREAPPGVHHRDDGRAGPRACARERRGRALPHVAAAFAHDGDAVSRGRAHEPQDLARVSLRDGRRRVELEEGGERGAG